MSDAPQKSSAGVDVTVRTEVVNTDAIKFSPHYFRTFPGILLLVEIVLAIICMICASPVVTTYTHFFMFVVVIFFITALSFCMIHLFSIHDYRNMKSIPWLLLEFMINVVAVVLHLIAVGVQLGLTSRHDYYIVLDYFNFFAPYTAAGVIALFNTIAYIGSAVLTGMEWKRQRSPISANIGRA